MAKASTRQGLIDYALRQNGAPVLEINIEDDQIDDLIDDAIQYFNERNSRLFTREGNPVNTQYNRLLYFSISKAPKWSFTLTQDFTSAYEGAVPLDPYYNPLEALISGDFKYFL